MHSTARRSPAGDRLYGITQHAAQRTEQTSNKDNAKPHLYDTVLQLPSLPVGPAATQARHYRHYTVVVRRATAEANCFPTRSSTRPDGEVQVRYGGEFAVRYTYSSTPTKHARRAMPRVPSTRRAACCITQQQSTVVSNSQPVRARSPEWRQPHQGTGLRHTVMSPHHMSCRHHYHQQVAHARTRLWLRRPHTQRSTAQRECAQGTARAVSCVRLPALHRKQQEIQ